MEAKSLELYHIGRCGATVEWDLYYFIVKEPTEHAHGQTLGYGEDEDIEPVWLTKKEAMEKCLEGKVMEDRSLGILMRYLSQSS